MQSTVAQVMDQPLVGVMICTCKTYLMLINHLPAILGTHINFHLVMSMVAAKKLGIFLLASPVFIQLTLKFSTENRHGKYSSVCRMLSAQLHVVH